MSIIVDIGPFECEITEDGELIFLNYNITHDLAAMEFGYPETPALVELWRWDRHSFSMLMDLLIETISREEAALIGRAWLDMVCKFTGVEHIYTHSVKGVIEEMDAAVAAEDTNKLEEIERFVGSSASAYQQQVWRSHPYRYGDGASVKTFIADATLGLSVASALSSYLAVLSNTMQSAAFWMRYSMLSYNGKDRAINQLKAIPSHAIHDIAFVELSKESDGLVSDNRVTELKKKIGKRFAGAAVAIVAQQRGL